MKALGIVAEYNPFHNGHKYQIARAKELCGADIAVAVMSGSFVQRGEPAICDKWSRAKMALLCGIDLVIELPVVFSAQSAEYFATGAVKLLNEIGVDYISFGVETDDIQKLTDAAKILSDEPEIFKTALARSIKSGLSFPSARENALKSLGIDDIIATPNNILAIEYLKAMIKSSSKMSAIPVKRFGSQHDKIGSASYIRSISINKADKFMPKESFEILKSEIQKGKAPVSLKSIESAVISRLRLISPFDLAQISGVSEGLENRIKQGAMVCTDLNSVIDFAKTKRYTHSRLRRIMINTLLGIKNDDIIMPPQYIRVLGMNNNGRLLLKKLKETSALPVIVKTANAEETKMLKLDFNATDIYSLMYPHKDNRIGGLDKTTSPIVL